MPTGIFEQHGHRNHDDSNYRLLVSDPGRQAGQVVDAAVLR